MSYQIINGEYVRMRREGEMPQDMTEQSIENALVESGLDREDIEFRTIMGPNNTRYIRYRYWRPIDTQVVQELGLIEDADWDDDCGYRYSYTY